MTNKEIIRTIVKSREDLIKTRIRIMNRAKLQKDGSKQKMENQTETIVTDSQLEEELMTAIDFSENEKKYDKLIKKYIKNEPIYTQFLKDVKGCGPQMSAVIISEIDIHKADTVSRIYQYAGMNANLIKGKIKNADNEVVISDTQIRGDKPAKGFILPYNKFLKCNLLGILADCFIKSKSPYTDYYYKYKARLETSEKITIENGKEKMWKDCTPLHRNNAARRYMIKKFILDLYIKWRELEKLPVSLPFDQQFPEKMPWGKIC